MASHRAEHAAGCDTLKKLSTFHRDLLAILNRYTIAIEYATAKLISASIPSNLYSHYRKSGRFSLGSCE
jgi:phosphoserine aminotransferase